MVRVGDAGGTDRYINRAATFDADSTTNVVWYGETADQGYPARQPQYGDTAWSSTTSSTLSWYSEIFNGGNGNSSYPNSSQFYNGEDFSLNLPPIPGFCEWCKYPGSARDL